MSKIVVLGAGMVGKAIAIDLSYNHHVTSADIDEKSLKYLKENYNIKTVPINLMEEEKITQLVSGFDLVISAVPGFMGYDVVQTVIEAGKNIVDISFMPEDYMDLNTLAASKGVTAITDCGVAPGMPNLIAGYMNELMEIESLEYVVGGLPKVKIYPFNYKAPFSPIDVIEEYIRPARMIENGKLVVKEPLTEPEYIDFSGVGTLEAFNSDGLRTLAYTMKGKDMKEKTLRFPGHIGKIQLLKDMGFFSGKKIEFDGCGISPLEMSTRVIIPQWKFEDHDRDITVMRVIFEGTEDGKKKRYTYDMTDRFDTETKVHSMARTTGYTATVTARLLAEGKYERAGISPPEYVGEAEGCLDYVLKGLQDRGIVYKLSTEEI